MEPLDRSLRAVLRETGRAWTHGGARLLSASVAFYALLSAVPVFMLAIRVAGAATSEDAARRALLQNLARWIGRTGTATVADALGTALSHASRNPWSLEALVLLYASSRLFAVLQRALHLLWDVPLASHDRLRHKVLAQLRRRATAVSLVGVVSVILVALVAWNALAAWAHGLFGHHPGAWRASGAAVSFALAVLLFTAIFKVLPEARVSTRDASMGALVTAALFALGAALVGAYVKHKAAQSVFGAASSLVMLLLWVNYSAQVFFLGASFTAAWARLRGDGIHPRA